MIWILRSSILLFLVLFILPAQAQNRRDLNALLAQAKAGAREEVRKLLPSLKESHPDKAGVLFLEAICEEDAEKAVELYQRIVNEYPRSSWADDALNRLAQYSYAVGAYKTARAYTEQLAREYPQSPYVPEEQRGSGRNGGSPGSSARSGDTGGSDARGSGNGDARSYAVQVGAFSKQADAQKQVVKLKEKGYTAYLREKTVNGRTVHAVWLGIFTDFNQARAFAGKLKEQQGLDALVVRR